MIQTSITSWWALATSVNPLLWLNWVEMSWPNMYPAPLGEILHPALIRKKEKEEKERKNLLLSERVGMNCDRVYCGWIECSEAGVHWLSLELVKNGKTVDNSMFNEFERVIKHKKTFQTQYSRCQVVSEVRKWWKIEIHWCWVCSCLPWTQYRDGRAGNEKWMKKKFKKNEILWGLSRTHPGTLHPRCSYHHFPSLITIQKKTNKRTMIDKKNNNKSMKPVGSPPCTMNPLMTLWNAVWS